MDRKSVGSSVRIKDAAKGQVTAVFSTFNVIDKDGDVTVPEAMQNGAEVVISAYGHKSWMGELPVGKGVVRTTKSEAIVDAQFFMDTTHGRDTFNTVAQLAKSGLGEWSYGFDVVDAEPATFDGVEVRMLKSLKVFEVSPVLQGAGMNTRTTGTKSVKDGTKGVAAVTYHSAIKPHETKTTRGAWNAVKESSAIASDASVDQLRAVHAWVNPEADPENKASYKFHHHDINGKANIRACIMGIAALNGATGDCGIPDGDRRGVYNHLANHLEDADHAIPELRTDTKSGSLKFTDEIAATLAQVSALINRASEVMALRAMKGRLMSRESAELLEWLHDDMRQLKTIIDTPQEDLAAQFIRYVGIIKNRE